jgi:hypothetical protein
VKILGWFLIVFGVYAFNILAAGIILSSGAVGGVYILFTVIAIGIIVGGAYIIYNESRKQSNQ